MPLSPGTRVGAYEITGLLGAGGMGEVYRARDTKLDRDVALKILPPEFARDAERIARFRREAKTLASINHPHIAPPIRTPFSEVSAAFSPDGRWVAYSTDRSGRDEIVAQSFPDPSRSVQLSLPGGRTPHWSADGREVFFLAPDGKMMAVTFSATTAGPKAGSPVALFQTQLGDHWGVAQYDVDRDGRFLMDLGNQPAPPIRLLLNWKPGTMN